ncbi:MAG: L-histidine N(alpha)-methyltransferase [Bordetella sp.]|nr:L-histidine N(alpha)-methyltransferase [Bordetella sp.]
MAHPQKKLAAEVPADNNDAAAAAVRQALADGLLAPHAQIEPKFLYDTLGSSLFTAITQLPEYYPTRCEAEIFARHAADIAAHTGSVQTLIDLGAGDCVKAERLFPTLKPRRYIPVDISADYLQQAVDRLRRTWPDIQITALGLDFSQGLRLPPMVPPAQRLFFYPGSSIGNLDPDAALAMLVRIRNQSPEGGLLVGIDRIKPREVLEPAYDDALHLTAAFNLNMLRHVNQLVGTDFDVQDWAHHAFYNEQDCRIEMHLRARCGVVVSWPGGTREFVAGETIHTENSHKYSVEGFTDLLERAGFRDIRHWSDARDWFSVFSART